MTIASQGCRSLPDISATKSERGGTLLIIEDHTDTRETMSRLLSLRGWKTTCARSCAAARERVREAEALNPKSQRPPFDAALIDIRLTDGNGCELLQELRSIKAISAALAFSASAMHDDLERAMAAGFDEFLTKPATAAQVEEALLRACSRQHTA